MTTVSRASGTAGAAVASSAAVRGAAARDRVCIAAVAGPHGLGGDVRIKSFTEVPGDVGSYGRVSDESDARQFEIHVLRTQGRVVVASLSGVEDRDAAEALRGTRFYVPRAALPTPGDDEYYHADLLGLAAEGTDGRPVGEVVSIIPVGEMEVLEIDRGDGRETLLLEFTAEAVREVDLASGRIVIQASPQSGAGGEHQRSADG